MPDSIRELLQGIAGDEPGPSGDLAAGAYRRARRIGRRRFAAAAVAAVTGLMLASATTAALVNPNGVEEPPPAGPTALEETTGYTTAPDEHEGTPTKPEPDGGAETCDGTVDWAGWGPSNSIENLDELPEDLYFEVPQADAMTPEIVRFDREMLASTFTEADFRLAPDGDRYVTVGDGECDNELGMLEGGESFYGLGLVAGECAPSWSPTSDQVVLNLPDAESDQSDGGYLLDVATGKTEPLPEGVGCSPRWSADGGHLFSSDGAVGMAVDGGELIELAGAEQWSAEPGLVGLSSISADLTRACLEFGATAEESDGESSAEADSSGTGADRCDRYVDTATGAELALPVEAVVAQVVFLPDGSMIVCDNKESEVKVYLVDDNEDIQDVRSLPRQGPAEMMLRGYFTG